MEVRPGKPEDIQEGSDKEAKLVFAIYDVYSNNVKSIACTLNPELTNDEEVENKIVEDILDILYKYGLLKEVNTKSLQ